MEDFRIKTSWRGHRKRKRLMRKLGHAGVLAVVDLWSYVASDRPTGDLTGLTDEDIADEAGWEGDPLEFIFALVDLILLDGGPLLYQVHNWRKHNPYVAGHVGRSKSARSSALVGHHKRGHHRANPVKDCPQCCVPPAESCEPQAERREAQANACEPPAPSPSPYPDPTPEPDPQQAHAVKSIALNPDTTPSKWIFGDPIVTVADLHQFAARAGLGIQIDPRTIKRARAMLSGHPITVEETEAAMTKTEAIDGAGGLSSPVAYFLGVVEGLRRDKLKPGRDENATNGALKWLEDQRDE